MVVVVVATDAAIVELVKIVEMVVVQISSKQGSYPTHLKQRRLLARLWLHRLELANRVCVAKGRLRSACSDLGGLAVLPLAVEHVELGAE